MSLGQYPPHRTVTVGPGGMFGSIGAAITSVATAIPAPSATAQVLIKVAPGVYPEAGFTIPAGVTLASSGPAQAVATIAAIGAGTLVTIAPGAALRGFTLSAIGVAGVTLVAHSGAAGNALVNEINAINGDIGYSASGAGAQLTLVTVTAVRLPGAGAGTAAVRAAGGAAIRGVTVSTLGSAGADVWTRGFTSTGTGSAIRIVTGQTDLCTTGVFVDDGGIAVVLGGSSNNCTTALHIGATGAGGSLRTFVLSIIGSVTWDILIDGTAGSWFDSGSTIDDSKRSIPAGASVIAASIGEEPTTNEFALSVLGELHVGSPENPMESAFGEGDSHIRGMTGLQSVSLDAGPFVDITTEISSPSGSTALPFTTGAVNNAFFLGGDLPFPHARITTTTAIALATGVLVVEISDGVGGWIPINICACDANTPYLSHAQDIFGRVAQEQVRFETVAGWGAQTINGESKYWLRISVTVGALGTNPAVEFIKLGTNHSEVNADGTIESFGSGEQVRELIFHQRLTDDLGGASPTNAAINFSANVTITPIDNSFNGNALDGVGAIMTIPEGLDTSRPIEFHVHWIPAVNTAGDVEFETNSVEVRVGDVLNGTLPEVLQQQIISVGAGEIDVVKEAVFFYDVSNLEPEEQCAFSFFRDATAGNLDDTLAGAVEIVSMQLLGTFWR